MSAAMPGVTVEASSDSLDDSVNVIVEPLVQGAGGMKFHDPDVLADIAAEHNVPIDLHMEALPQDIPAPADLKPPNPSRLHGNIAAFERLLAHNRKARIVWVHLGWDVTGFRTLDLTRALLARHENLYLQLRPLPPPQPPLSHRRRREGAR